MSELAPNSKVVLWVGGQQFDLELKNTFFQRLCGLLGVNQLAENKGIVLAKSRQVHTFGMKFPIDIVVLDKDFQIIDFVGDLRVNKISPYYRRGYYIIELAMNIANQKIFRVGNVCIFKFVN